MDYTDLLLLRVFINLLYDFIMTNYCKYLQNSLHLNLHTG